MHGGDTTDEIRERLVADWWAARQSGGRQLMVATRRSDVDDLNRRARARLQDAGHLNTHELLIGGRSFAVGDDVLATRNDYRLGVLNGTRATITGLDVTTGDLSVRVDDGRDLVIPFTYVEAGHLTHGYATTLHKAQGATVRQAFLLADDTITHQRGYSGLSRGVDRNDLYAVGAPDDRHDTRHAHEQKPEPLEQLAQTLACSEAKTLSLDELLGGRVVARSDTAPLSMLLSEQHRLRARIGREPRHPLGEMRLIQAEQKQAERRLAAARAERQAAEEALGQTRKLRRVPLRGKRSQLNDRLADAARAETRAGDTLELLEAKRDRIEDQITEWQTWRNEHHDDLTSLHKIDFAISDRTPTPETALRGAPDHTPAIDHGLGLGW